MKKKGRRTIFLKRKGKNQGAGKTRKNSHPTYEAETHVQSQVKESLHIYYDGKRILGNKESSKPSQPFIFLRSSKLEQSRNKGGNWRVVNKWLSITWTTLSTFKSSITPLFKLEIRNGYKTITSAFMSYFMSVTKPLWAAPWPLISQGRPIDLAITHELTI